MRPVRRLAVAILSAGLSAAALAADPAAGPADLPENALPAPAVDTARHERRAAFDAVVAGQDAKVRALAGRLQGATGEEALAIQRDIEREKIAVGRLLLEVQLGFAARDGDRARVERLQSALAAWDAPAPVYAPVDRQVSADRPAPTNPGR